MAVSIEAYLGLNLAMNALCLGLLARAQGAFRLKNVLFAAAFGALYAGAMLWPPFYLLRLWPFQALLLLCMSLIALRTERWRDVPINAGKLLAASALLAGGQTLLATAMGRSPFALLLGTLGATWAFLSATDKRAHPLAHGEVRLRIENARGRVELRALVDTGNRLREPISGLPVVVVEARLVAALMPDDLSAGNLPRGVRMVAYGALGGGGRMPCFRPDRVLASYGDGWMETPDVWIAAYQSRMPGAYRALAPPVLGSIRPARPASRRLLPYKKGERGIRP